MYVPKKEKDGLRRYGSWAGNPKGSKEDITRCIVSVSDGAGWHRHQCRRPRGHGPAGEYCRQHGAPPKPRPAPQPLPMPVRTFTEAHIRAAITAVRDVAEMAADQPTLDALLFLEKKIWDVAD